MADESKLVDEKESRYTTSDRLGIALACLAGVMAVILFLVEKTPWTVGSLLVVMVALLVYPVLHFVEQPKSRVWVLVCLVIVTAIFGWREWPEQQKPFIHITQFHPRYGPLNIPNYPGLRAWVDVDTINTAPEQAWRVTSMGDVKVIPFPPHGDAANAETEIFTEIARSTAFSEMPTHITQQQNVPYIDHVLSKREISQSDFDGLKAGTLGMLVGGVIKYKDGKGCVYKTELCGYWRGGANEMNPCPNGHSAEGIRTGDECTP